MLGWENFFAGWVGGIAGLTIGHPFDTIKVREQAIGENLIKTFKQTLKTEGPAGFYKGFFAPFLTIGPTNAVFFYAYSNVLKTLQHNQSSDHVNFNDPHWMWNVTVAGIIGGFIQVAITCPVELVKTVLQTKTSSKGAWKLHYEAPYNTTFKAVVGIYRNKGIPGFYRGFMPMIWRDVPASGMYMYVYEILLPRGDVQPMWKQLMAGGFAGIASWCLVIPFDVIKTRMQSDNPDKPLYKGMMDCCYKSYRAEGASIFLRGFWLSTMRSFPVNAAVFYGYEKCLHLFKKKLE